MLQGQKNSCIELELGWDITLESCITTDSGGPHFDFVKLEK